MVDYLKNGSSVVKEILKSKFAEMTRVAKNWKQCCCFHQLQSEITRSLEGRDSYPVVNNSRFCIGFHITKNECTSYYNPKIWAIFLDKHKQISACQPYAVKNYKIHSHIMSVDKKKSKN